MKIKTIPFLLLLMFTAGLARSQTSRLSTTGHHSHIKNVIVEEYNHPKYMTCINSGDDSVSFMHVDGAFQCEESIIRGYWVNDIAVANDTLFFCGRTANGKTTKGIFGFFRIDPGLLKRDTIYIYEDFKAGESFDEVTELTRMLVYRTDFGERHIACVGTCKSDVGSCLIDIYPDAFFSTTWYYYGGTTRDPKESLTDVNRFWTEYYGSSHLVTAGFDNTYMKSITLRVYDPNFVFSPSGIQDIGFNFCNDPSSSLPWTGDKVLLSNVTAGTFSTVSYRSRSNSKSSANDDLVMLESLHFGFYKLSSLLGISSTAMTSNFYVSLFSDPGKTLHEYIVKPSSKTLVALHTYTGKSIFCKIPYPSLSSSGTLDAFYYNDTYLQSMSIYNSNNKYLLGGYRKANDTWLRFGLETFGSNSLCAEMVDYKYIEKEVPTSSNLNKPYSYSGGIIEWKPLYPVKRGVGLSDLCRDGQ